MPQPQPARSRPTTKHGKGHWRATAKCASVNTMLILIRAIREREFRAALRQNAQLTQSKRVSRGGSSILPNGFGLAPLDGTRNNERLYRFIQTAETRDYHDNRNHWRRQYRSGHCETADQRRNPGFYQQQSRTDVSVLDCAKALAVGSRPLELKVAAKADVVFLAVPWQFTRRRSPNSPLGTTAS